MSRPPLCLYHGDCLDGFAAACAVRKALPTAEFIACEYGKARPFSVVGRDVIIVDFSYKRAAMETIVAECSSLIVLDHHETAEEDLRFLLQPNGDNYDCVQLDHEKCAIFDMNRSGAGLAWDYFHSGTGFGIQRPLFIDYIEDRDLWRKRLEGVDEFTFALRSYPRDFEVWDRLITGSVGALIAEGVPIKRYYRMRVEEMKQNAYDARIKLHDEYGGTTEVLCRIVNAPRIFASEVAGEIAENSPDGIGASFFQHADGRWEYSLRSRGSEDVSKIAQSLGGGGHAKASGFTVRDLVHVRAAG